MDYKAICIIEHSVKVPITYDDGVLLKIRSSADDVSPLKTRLDRGGLATQIHVKQVRKAISSRPRELPNQECGVHNHFRFRFSGSFLRRRPFCMITSSHA